jgi:hypothetical protein
MPRATRYDTDSEFKIPLRTYLIDALAIAVILLSGGIASCLIASNLEGKIAHHCALELQRGLE